MSVCLPVVPFDVGLACGPGWRAGGDVAGWGTCSGACPWFGWCLDWYVRFVVRGNIGLRWVTPARMWAHQKLAIKWYSDDNRVVGRVAFVELYADSPAPCGTILDVVRWSWRRSFERDGRDCVIVVHRSIHHLFLMISPSCQWRMSSLAFQLVQVWRLVLVGCAGFPSACGRSFECLYSCCQLKCSSVHVRGPCADFGFADRDTLGLSWRCLMSSPQSHTK